MKVSGAAFAAPISLLMLPKSYRLKNQSAFIATYKNHHIISNEYISIYIGKEKNDSLLNTRFAFVVSKKVHKRAVVRNRIKRLMRETVRLAIKNNELDNINKYISIICIAKSPSSGVGYKAIKSSVYSLLSQLI